MTRTVVVAKVMKKVMTQLRDKEHLNKLFPVSMQSPQQRDAIKVNESSLETKYQLQVQFSR